MKKLLVVFSFLVASSAFADRSQINCMGTALNVAKNTLEKVDLEIMPSDRDFWTGSIGNVAFSVDFYRYESHGILSLFVLDKEKDFSVVSHQSFHTEYGNELVTAKMVDGYLRGENINYEVRCFRK